MITSIETSDHPGQDIHAFLREALKDYKPLPDDGPYMTISPLAGALLDALRAEIAIDIEGELTDFTVNHIERALQMAYLCGARDARHACSEAVLMEAAGLPEDKVSRLHHVCMNARAGQEEA